jgi:hypothetical protein
MKILNTSGNCELLSIRSEYLWALGFEVSGVLAPMGFDELISRNEAFDFAVLCYTLSREQKLLVREVIRTNCPSTQIIELYLSEAPVTPCAIDASEFRFMMRSLAAHVGGPGLSHALAVQIGSS